MPNGNEGWAWDSRSIVAWFAQAIRASRIGATSATALRSLSRSTVSEGSRRSIRTWHPRSLVGSGRGWPIPHRTLGEKVENAVSVCTFTPDCRCAFPPSRQPELIRPQ
jgi:hypothetical protein